MRYLRSLHVAVFTLSLLGLAYVATLGMPVARAQADLGSCSGVVTDATGAVIPNAQVTLTNVATGAVRTTVTNSRGEYSVTQLLPATYTVNFSAPGFSPASQQLVITVGSSNTMSVKLAVEGGSTQITVAADDFAGVHLEKPEVAAVIETDQILSLPTLDRNPYNLVAFSGNLSSDPSSAAANRGVGFNISGSRSTAVDILLDGAENTDLYAVGVGQSVPMDATSEIRVVTSNSGAEYGRGSGAVNVSTKSGTNALHGSAYEFNRISTFASDGYNNNYIHDMNPFVPAKPRYVHNQFGYSVGGPVKKDRLFFFSSTEWTRIRSQQNVIAVVPTPDLIALAPASVQSFFATYGTLKHPINGSTFTGDSTAVQNVFGGDVADLSATIPSIGATPLFGQDIYQAPLDSGGGAPVNQWITFNRGDWTINQTTSLFARYIQESAVNPAGYINNGPYQGYDTGQTQYNHNLEISLTKAFTANLASATKLLGSRTNNSQPLGANAVSPTLYVNSVVPVTLGGGYINFPGYSQTSPGNALPFGGPQNFIELGEDLAWTKGKQQFAFGGNFLYIKDNRTFGAYEEAVDALVQAGQAGALDNFISGNLGLFQVAINPQGAYPCTRNSNTGAYNHTTACQFQTPAVSPNFSRSNRYQDGAAYASDSWKVDRRLTVNLGLRWEIYGPQHSQRPDYDSNFFFGTGNTIWDRIASGKVLTRANAPNGRLWKLNTKQFGPRIGFAWDPVGNGRTSIRGGYGISYERNFNNVTFNVIQNPPNYAVVLLQNVPLMNSNFNAYGAAGSSYLPNVTLRAVDPNIKPAYASNWSMSVERQLGTTTASVSYVGTRGIHNYSVANINRVFDGPTYLGYGYAAGRSNLQYSNINFRGADGDSYYHGLTAEVRSSNLLNTGLTVRGDYTYSHSIDNTSSTFTDGGSNDDNLGYLDPFNKALDRGNSDFDQRHRVASAIIWELPFARQLRGTSKMLADNWTISTTFDAQTGNYYTMFDCSYAYTVCPRASFASPQAKGKSRDMVDLSGTYGPNTFSYKTFPAFWDPNAATDGNDVGILLGNYNEQINPFTGTSDTPICSGLYGAGCQFVPGMTGRNSFAGPGSWHQNLGIVKDFKFHERYNVQLKGEFINLFNHANTYLNLTGTNDVSLYTDVLAYKNGNRNTELSLHVAF